MKILFNNSCLAQGKTGIGHYADQLMNAMIRLEEVEIKGLKQISSQATEGGVQSFLRSEILPRTPMLLKKVARRTRRIKNRIWETGRLRFSRFDLYHEPNYILLPIRGPKVLTICDCSHLRFPQFHPQDRLDYFGQYLPRSILQADHIITISQFSKQEIVECFGVSAERISVTYLGAGDHFHVRTPEQVSDMLHRWGLRCRGYLLSVATLEPRKNLLSILKAYQHLSTDQRQAYPLVLVGGTGWLSRQASRELGILIEKLGVTLTGYVSDHDLAALYAGAYASIYASFYEGFGLPVLESFQSGTPVICSRVASIPEVGGDAAVYCDPHDPDSIRQSMEHLLSLSPAEYAQQVERCLNQAKGFSWHRCAQGTIEVYREVLNQS